MSGYFSGRSGASQVVTVGVIDYVTYVMYVQNVVIQGSTVCPSHLQP